MEIGTPGLIDSKYLRVSFLIRAFLVRSLYFDMNCARGGLPRAHASHHQQQGQNHRAIEQVIDGSHEDDGHESMAQIQILYVGAGERKPDYADDGDELQSLQRKEPEKAVHPKSQQPQARRPYTRIAPPVPLVRTEEGLLKSETHRTLVSRQPCRERSAPDLLEKIRNRACGRVVLDKGSQRDDVSQPQTGEGHDPEHQQHGAYARKIAAADEDERQQRDKQNDAPARLAHQRHCEQDRGYPASGYTEDAIYGVALP